MKKHLILLASAVIALASCQKTITTTGGEGSAEISFKTEINKPTKVAGSNFESGDEISVSATNDQKATYNYNGTQFVSESPITKDDASTMLVYRAVYPKQSDINSAFDFTIQADQTSSVAYSNSDLLAATTEATESLQPKLSFYHKMSCLLLSFKLTDGTLIEPTEVKVMAKNVAACDVVKGTYTGKGDATTISAKVNGTAKSYVAIVAPQTIAPNTAFITLQHGGKTYTAQFSTEAVLVSGSQYKYELTADPTTGEIVSIELIDAVINDWNDGTIDGGDEPNPNPDPQGDFSDFTLNAETGGYKGEQDASGSMTVGGIEFDYAGISATDTFGSTYISYENAGYIMNTTAFSGLTKIVVTGNGYVKDNLIVTVGTSENPTTVVESASPAGSGWGAEYEYVIPAGTTFIKFAANTASTHDAGVSSIAFDFDGNGGTVTPNPDPDPDPDPDPQGDFSDFTLNAETGGYKGEQDASGSMTVGGIDFDYAGISATDTFGSTYISYENAGYIMNTTAFSGLTKIVVTGNGYVKDNLIVTVGTSENPTTVVESASPAGSGWGAEYEYVIPAGTTFIKFAANTASTHDAGVSSIAFDFDGNGGTTNPDGGDGGTVTPDPSGDEVVVTIVGSQFTHDDATASDNNGGEGYPFAASETVGDFTFDFVSGSSPTRNWWYKEAWQMRFYTGSTTTITCNVGTITKIEMAGYPEFTADGYADKVWEGSSKSVEFTGTKTGKVDSFKITYTK